MTVTRMQVAPNVTDYTVGSFWWTDLSTSDLDAAKQFYTELMNWTYEDMPMPNGTYSMASRDGNEVVGLMPLGDLASQGIPPNWLSYVLVDDVKATAAKVVSLGGTVMREPWEIEGAGWMAVIIDPTGAAFAIWQAIGHKGAQAVNAPGALCWTSLSTTDTAAAGRFYSELFGWELQAQDGAMDGYTMFMLNGRPVGGMSGMMPGMEGVPSFWDVVIGVDDADAALAYVKANGGSVTHGPNDTPWGRMFGLQDPQGARLTVCGIDKQM